jgi:hypothetical protein
MFSLSQRSRTESWLNQFSTVRKSRNSFQQKVREFLFQEGTNFQIKKKMLIGKSRRYTSRKLAWRHQYSSRRHALLCSLAGWMDRKLCLDQISSDRIGSEKVSSISLKVKKRNKAPQGVKEDPQYNFVSSFIFCKTNPYLQEKELKIHLHKLFSLLVTFQVPCLKHQVTSREEDTTVEAFFISNFSRKQQAKFSGIKYSMLGWFQNHHTCFWRHALVTQVFIFCSLH